MVKAECKPLIIDTQVHIFRIAKKHIPRFNREFSAELLISRMDEAGVDKAILISYEGKYLTPPYSELAGDPDNMDVDKEYFIDACRKYPDRFIWFTDHIDPGDPDYMKGVEKDIKRGAKGIKLLPAYGPSSTLPDDARFIPLYERCAELSLPIIMAFEHWNDPSLGAYIGDDYEEFLGHFEPIAKQFPGVDFLLTHWGCFTWGKGGAESRKPPFPRMKPFAELLSKYDNLTTDIAAIAFILGFQDGLRMIEELVKLVGIEKIMYGTDWPWTEGSVNYKDSVTMIWEDATFLSEEQKRLLLGLNAAKFLKLEV